MNSPSSQIKYINNMNSLGPQVKYLRKKQNITLDRLSELSGVNRATINAYENERYIPNVKTVSKILDALGYELCIVNKGTLKDYRDSL